MMKKLFFTALAATLFTAGCSEATTETQQIATPAEVETTGVTSVTADSAAMEAELDKATLEIEHAQAEVDSLLSEI